jgi:hypothetical protein
MRIVRECLSDCPHPEAPLGGACIVDLLRRTSARALPGRRHDLSKSTGNSDARAHDVHCVLAVLACLPLSCALACLA